MTLKGLLSAALVTLSASSFAQNWTTDSIAMGTGYTNDVYYLLKDGSTKLQAGNDWHLGFQMSVYGEPNFNAAVRASHVKKSMEVYVISNKASADFATIGAADTVGKTSPSMALINNDTSWGTTAFYQNRSVPDAYSFGWGIYDPSSHDLNGNVVYLLKTNSGAFKLWIQKYVSYPTDSVRYTFRVAKLDGSNDNTVTIHRKGTNMPFTDRLFAYYNIDSNTIINREPSRPTWDMVFTQYRQLIPDGTGGMMPYNLTGVLTNQSAEVAKVSHIDVNDPAHLTNYKTYARTTHIDGIGADWKTYVNPGPNGYYKIEDSSSYFIKTKTDNAYYQLQFLRFDGGGAAGMGKIVFQKRYLGKESVSVSQVASSVNAWYVVPNPAADVASVMIDAKTATPSARLIVTDMAGRMVANAPVDVRQGMNAFSLSTGTWPAGVYAVQVAGGDLKISTRLVVAH